MIVMRQFLDKLLAVPGQLDKLERAFGRIDDAIDVLIRKPPDPPFVCVLVEGLIKETVSAQQKEDYGFGPVDTGMLGGRIEKVRRSSFGCSTFLIDRQHTFRIQPHSAMHNLRIVVFCDLSKVNVKDITCANQPLFVTSMFSGGCPVAYFEGTLSPVNVMTIVVEKIYQ